MVCKILFSNIGYAKGIDGSLRQHVLRAVRHFYCPIPVQQQVLGQVRAIVHDAQPDICCFVEVDSGSFSSAYMNHLEFLVDEHYPHSDIADKYGENSTLGRLPMFTGKSNGFLSKQQHPFDRLYFTRGTKRLMYRLCLPNDTILFFGHFSLQQSVRALQFTEMNALIKAAGDKVIVLADFNILRGLGELAPLLDGTTLRVMNDAAHPTFTFHTKRHLLDICLCSESIANDVRLHIVPQPFSDHAALLLEVVDKT